MIPKKPFRFYPLRMTIDQTIFLAEIVSSGKIDIGQVVLLKRVLVDCSDWTEKEVGALRWEELNEVLGMINKELEKEREEAVPPAQDASSEISELA